MEGFRNHGYDSTTSVDTDTPRTISAELPINCEPVGAEQAENALHLFASSWPQALRDVESIGDKAEQWEYFKRLCGKHKVS